MIKIFKTVLITYKEFFKTNLYLYTNFLLLIYYKQTISAKVFSREGNSPERMIRFLKYVKFKDLSFNLI